MSELFLSALYIYPIKSAAGIPQKTVQLTARGLQHDRRYMVVGPDGQFMTQRRFPKMAVIRAQMIDEQLAISAPGLPNLRLPVPTGEYGKIEAEVWGDRTLTLSCGPTAQAWFTNFLGTRCQLVYMSDTSCRPTDHGKLGLDKIVSFADAYPYLLLSEASLMGLNHRLSAKKESPVRMNRFRPNLVVRGDMPPHAEDEWNRIRIGDAIFNVAKPCARCSVPNVNQESGIRTKEPSRTLATYRAWDKEIWFGQNLIQEKPGSGRLKIGDEVEILT